VLALGGVLISGSEWLKHGTGNSGMLLTAMIFWVLSVLPSIAFLCRKNPDVLPMMPVILFSGLFIIFGPLAIVISDNTTAGLALVIVGLILYVLFGLGWAANYYPLFSIDAGIFWSALGGLVMLITLSIFVHRVSNGFWTLCQGKKAYGIGVSGLVLGLFGDLWVVVIVLQWISGEWRHEFPCIAFYSCLGLIPFLILGSVMAGVHGELKGGHVYTYKSNLSIPDSWQLEMQCVNAADADEEEKWRKAFVDALDLEPETGIDDAQKKLDDFIRGRTRYIYRSYFICVFAQTLFNFTLLVGCLISAADS
jgi:hypothetical protein